MSRPSKAQREFVPTGLCEGKPGCKGKPMFSFYGTMYCLECRLTLPPEVTARRVPPKTDASPPSWL